MSRHAIKRMGASRRVAVVMGFSAAMLTAAAPGIASADDAAGTAADRSASTDDTSEDADDTSTDGASTGSGATATSPGSATTSSGSDSEGTGTGSVTVPSEVATGAAPSTEPSAPVQESDTATTGPVADNTNTTDEVGAAPVPTTEPSTTEPSELTPTSSVPYGRHALPDSPAASHPVIDPSTGSPAHDADTPAPSFVDVAETAHEDTPSEWSTDRAEWRTDDEIASLASISGQDAHLRAVDPDTAADGTNLPTATEAALALGTIGVGAVASRRTLSFDMTPEEIEQYYAELHMLAAQEQAADPSNRFLNYGDTDWGIGASEGPPPAGLTYSVPDDNAGVFTLHNNSGVDVAITNLYIPTYSSQGLVIIKAGDSYTMPRPTEATPLGFTAYMVQTPRVDGAGNVVGRIMVTPSAQLGDSVFVSTATESITDYIPLQGYTTPHYGAEDPSNQFVDAGDTGYVGQLGSVSYADPVAAGVSYAVVNGKNVTIFNDGTTPIAVTQATPGFQTLTFDVLAPGESGTYAPVPGSWQMITVQAPKAADGSMVILGSIMRSSAGPTSLSPDNSIPAIPLRDAPPVTNQPPTGNLAEVSRSADGRSVTYRPQATDPDGDPITYSVVYQPSRGTVTSNADGTFTYTVTDHYYLHYGRVTDLFSVGASDGKADPTFLVGNVSIEFTQENNAPQVRVTSDDDPQSAIGYATYLLDVVDPDWGQYPNWIGFDQVRYSTTTPSFGSTDVVRLESGPVYVRYTPDLVRAHHSAYDTTFDIIVDDGQDGGRVVIPITVHVPFYNQNPVATIAPVAGSNGSFVTDAEFELTLTDDDYDDVTVVSLTTNRGGSAVLRDGKIIYTPVGFDTYNRVEYYSYSERITIVVDDGHGGQTEQYQNVYVRNTASLRWLDPGQARVLIFTDFVGLADDAAALVSRSTTVYAAGYQDKVKALEARFAPELNGYNDTLQRYMVRNYAMHVISDALITVSKSIAQIENVVRQIDAALEKRGFNGVRVTTQIALEFLNGFQRDIFGQIVKANSIQLPSREGENNNPVSDSPRTVAPISTSTLFRTLWTRTTKVTPIYIEQVVSDVDGKERMIVYIAGTDSSAGAQQSVIENAWASAFAPDVDVAAAISAAIKRHPPTDSDTPKEILIVGYSQGGLDGINITNMGAYNIVGVVTFGSPLSTAYLTNIPAIHIRDTRDEVPRLNWGYAESVQQLAGRVFSGKAATPDDWWTVGDVHTNWETYLDMGGQFDKAVTASSKYSAIASVLRKFTGDVTTSGAYGMAEGSQTWL